ncbi:protein kinase [Trypanosoma theileri]|uniref:Protein kinase n=1 Tax=Trypanosoma theileri TaxID=67003 RepID=A0A1X0P6M6_9TRYP|nr:protein kinase [Trypanosoma theileri]ORC92574.1 protein kinase [Trypanosoma theileri]
MSDTEYEDHVGTPPYRQRPATSSTDGYGEEDEDDVDTLNSSTSTAGPPGSRRTGRYRHVPWDTGSNTSCSSPGSSTQRTFHQRGGTSKRTGRYHEMFAGNRNSSNNRRSLSNASTVASLMGSVPEWSRSFCLFNPVRAGAGSRHSLCFSHQYLFSGKNTTHTGGVTSPPSTASPSAGGMSPGHEFHRSSVSFGTSLNFVLGSNQAGADVSRSTSALFVSGQLHSPSVSASPLLGGNWGGWQSLLMNTPTSPTTTASYAMGGAARLHGNAGIVNVSPARKELPMLLQTLCCYLSLTGSPIISTNMDPPVDARKGPLIGVGGFAKVYAGVDCVTGRLIAIKEINIAEVNDHSALNAIGKEFGLLKSLRHPNIVSYQLFEHSASQKVCRIVMELLTGGSTLGLLERYGPLREPILRRFARHLLQAIAFIHKEGIYHRDIKPANILVSHDGVVKLCDFGCSKRVNELSKSTSCVIGTPLYMAPEFIKGEANHKSDIWSMACSLFELGTGLLPWHHAGVRDNLPLMFYITTTSETPLVLPPQSEMQNFSPEFMDFMGQCFIRNVDRRPEAAELLHHPWITGKRVGTPEISSPIPGGNYSQNLHPWTGSLDEEVLCQHELEDVAANISVEMCSTWLGTNDRARFSSSPAPPVVLRQEQQQQQQQQVDFAGRHDELLQHTLEHHPLDSQATTTNSGCPSPAVSSRCGGLAPISPTISLDAALHDNFNYTVPLGSSAGCFVLPSCNSPATPLVTPQYLRINADGNLDFAVAEEDLVEMGVDGDDLFASSYRQQFNRTPSFSLAFGTGSPVGSGGNTFQSSSQQNHLHVSSSTNNITNSNANTNSHSLGRSPAGRRTQRVSMVRDQSLSLISGSSFASRGVSPSRRSQAASTASLTTSQQLPSLLVMAGSNSFQPGASTNHSSDDAAGDKQGVPLSASTSRLPDGVKLDGHGRLHMSLSVPAGTAERSVNIALSIDPEDVQCKMIDQRPSYVVSLSEDVKTQLTAKMYELASSESSSPRDGQMSEMMHGPRRDYSRSTYGTSSMCVSPKSVSPSISPARRSFGTGPYMRYSPRQKRGSIGSRTGGGRTPGMYGGSNTNNNSPVGSSISVAHSSSNGGNKTPPYL